MQSDKSKVRIRKTGKDIGVRTTFASKAMRDTTECITLVTSRRIYPGIEMDDIAAAAAAAGI